MMSGDVKRFKVVKLLGLDLAVPDHSTLSRRAATVAVPRPRASLGSGPLHLSVDTTGLKLCGAGEWLHERHGTRVRRSWRELHLGVDAGTGRIVASPLTNRDVDDGSQVGPSLDRVEGPLACFTGDSAYDGEVVTASIGSRHLFIHEQREKAAGTGGSGGPVKPHVGHRTEVDGRQLDAEGGHVHPRTVVTT